MIGFSMGREQKTFVEQLFKRVVPVEMNVQIKSRQFDCTWDGAVVGLDGVRTLFLRGGNWDMVDLRESIVAVYELAEEHLHCQSLVICLDRLEMGQKITTELLHSFVYVGFEMLDQKVLQHNAERFTLVGAEL